MQLQIHQGLHVQSAEVEAARWDLTLVPGMLPLAVDFIMQSSRSESFLLRRM